MCVCVCVSVCVCVCVCECVCVCDEVPHQAEVAVHNGFFFNPFLPEARLVETRPQEVQHC